MARKPPTHHVKHRDGWEVNLYIAPSLEARLRSRDSEVRDGARRSVCIRFREACKAAYPDKWPYADGYPFIEWGQLSISKLGPLDPPGSSQPGPTPPSKPTPTPQGAAQECTCPDSCVMCDLGDHARCHRCARTI